MSTSSTPQVFINHLQVHIMGLAPVPSFIVCSSGYVMSK